MYNKQLKEKEATLMEEILWKLGSAASIWEVSLKPCFFFFYILYVVIQDVSQSLVKPVFCSQAVTGHEECVEALLQHSASFLVRDCKGRTPIHLAAACGHIGVLGGLLHAAQSVETLPVLTDNQGYTPLHWACYNGTEKRALMTFRVDKDIYMWWLEHASLPLSAVD